MNIGTTASTVLAVLHHTPARTRRAAAIAAAATFVGAGAFAGNVMPANSNAPTGRDDWPACALFTGMAGDKLKARGHSVKYVPLGSRGGFYWLDGVRVGKASAEGAPFMACATEKVIAPIRDVPRY